MRGLAFALALGAAAPAAADEARPPLPRGSRAEGPGHWVTRQRPADAVRQVAAELARRKTPHRAVPLTRIRGVLVARFVSEDPATPWLAVQIYVLDEQTRVAVVPRPAAP